MNSREKMVDWRTLDPNVVFKLHRQIAEQSSKKQVLSRLLKNILMKEHCYETKIDGKQGGILFFYSPDYYRFDNVTNFNSVVSCCDHASILKGTKRENSLKNLSLSAAFRRICSIPSLMKWHRKQWGTKQAFFRLAPFYFILEDQWKFLSKLDLTVFNGVVVYYDAWFTDAALVQLFKKMNKKTATLQHAFFAAKSDKSNVLGEQGIELECSNADYFLAWNDATVLEARKQGVDAEKFRVLGIPRYIGQDFEENSFEHNAHSYRFGVVLGVRDNEKQNISMIQIANAIAQKYGYKYYLKYHPAFLGMEYDAYTKVEYYLGNIEKGKSLEEYAKSVDFSIAGNSTVMMELLYLKYRTFHYTDKHMYEKYSEMQEITFSNFEEFENVFKVETEKFEEVRKRYCGPDDSRQKYCEFFKQLMINRMAIDAQISD